MELLHKFLSAPADFLWTYAAPFLLVLSVLVFIHEWGHYIVARLCGVRVETFSIGFGKEIFGWTDKNKTRWKVSWIPLGGFVQMFGDVDPASTRKAEGVEEGDGVRAFTAEEKKVAFFAQSVGKRSAIVFAGPAINFIFAIIIMTGLYAIKGQPFTPPIAASVMEGSAAEKAGIQPDDKILSIDGVEIERFEDLAQQVALSLGQEMVLDLVRSEGKGEWSDEVITLRVTPTIVQEEDRFGFKHEKGRLGIRSPATDFAIKEHTPVSAFQAALADTWRISANTLRAIGQMVMGTRSAEELGGILRIGAYAGEFAKEGVVSLVTFAALLSINLGLINLLPIPMLDGGHLAFYAMESVKRKPVSEKFQEYALRVGMVFILSIMVFATWNDLVQLRIVDYVMSLIS